MNIFVCKLTPKSSIHIGEREEWLESTESYIHSDTLFSAFCHSFLLLYGEENLEKLLSEFIEGNPPFLISSAFPWWKGKYYFPVPLNQIPEKKELKKIEFVAQSDFEKILSGEKLSDEMDTIPRITTGDVSKPWNNTEVPRLLINRMNNMPGENFFYFGETLFTETSGLYFLINFLSNNIEKQFKSTINLLVEEGIGGDRSSGKGVFNKPEFYEMKLNVPNTEGVISLSLYYPQKDELSDIPSGYYELIERKGYIYSPWCQSLRKKSVRMFAEGSVFPSKKIGRVVDITPQLFTEHKIYRYGLAFSLPCILEV